MIAQVSDLAVGEIVHTFEDTHSYSNPLEQVKLQLTREPKRLPIIKINQLWDITILILLQKKPKVDRLINTRLVIGICRDMTFFYFISFESFNETEALKIAETTDILTHFLT
jgi:hypothetical protein